MREVGVKRRPRLFELADTVIGLVPFFLKCLDFFEEGTSFLIQSEESIEIDFGEFGR